MNDENLIPMSKRSPRERKEIARKGAIASNKKQKEIRDMRQMCQMILSMPLKQGSLTEAKTLAGMDGKNMTTNQAIILQMAKKALNGDTKAAEFIRDTAGEKPSSQVEVSAPTKKAQEEFGALLDSVMEDGS